MKNILFVGATRNFLNEKIINKTLKEELADKAVLLVHEKSDAYIFEPLGRCIYREDAAKGNYPVIDVHNCGITYDNLSDYTIDGTHPNAEGAHLIAEYITKSLLY